ncbi:MAG: type II toxin-antitoxin system HigB family toxin [Alphaproteobacteria bacterium]
MRIIARQTLVRFWERHPETKVSLSAWHATVRAAGWMTMNDIRLAMPAAKVLNAERVRFEIKGGDYRLVGNVSGSMSVAQARS